jgi:hypothetical protein
VVCQSCGMMLFHRSKTWTDPVRKTAAAIEPASAKGIPGVEMEGTDSPPLKMHNPELARSPREYPSDVRASGKNHQPGQETLRRVFSPDYQCIDAEAPAIAPNSELNHQQDQEEVGPRPFGGRTI